MLEDVCYGLEERTSWIYNDLKAFQYIRLKRLQHGPDDIGGGNISMATLLFVMISLYSKINYFIERPDKFHEDGTVNEQEAFIKFAHQLKEAGIIHTMPNGGDSLGLIWRGFRDHLVHRFTIEDGKSAATFVFSSIQPDTTVTHLLDACLSEEVFAHDGNERNWTVNCDALHAKLPELCKFVIDKLRDSTGVDVRKLKEFVG